MGALNVNAGVAARQWLLIAVSHIVYTARKEARVNL